MALSNEVARSLRETEHRVTVNRIREPDDNSRYWVIEHAPNQVTVLVYTKKPMDWESEALLTREALSTLKKSGFRCKIPQLGQIWVRR